MKIQIKYNSEENHMQIDHISILVNVYVVLWIEGILMNNVANFDRKIKTFF